MAHKRTLTPAELRRYARIGAAAELRRILILFPDLTPAPDNAPPPKPPTPAQKDRRKGRRMTAAQRRAVGQRMRAYWEKRRRVKAA